MTVAGDCAKRKYDSRAEAKREKRRHQGKGIRALRAYLCPDCESWHLGHQPKMITAGFASRAKHPFRPTKKVS